MVDVRGDVLRPPHGTKPAAVKANKIQKLSSFKSNENIHKREVCLGYDVKYGKYEVKSLNSDDGDQYVETIQVSPMIQVSAISVG